MDNGVIGIINLAFTMLAAITVAIYKKWYSGRRLKTAIRETMKEVLQGRFVEVNKEKVDDGEVIFLEEAQENKPNKGKRTKNSKIDNEENFPYIPEAG